MKKACSCGRKVEKDELNAHGGTCQMCDEETRSIAGRKKALELEAVLGLYATGSPAVRFLAPYVAQWLERGGLVRNGSLTEAGRKRHRLLNIYKENVDFVERLKKLHN